MWGCSDVCVCVCVGGGGGGWFDEHNWLYFCSAHANRLLLMLSKSQRGWLVHWLKQDVPLIRFRILFSIWTCLFLPRYCHRCWVSKAASQPLGRLGRIQSYRQSVSGRRGRARLRERGDIGLDCPQPPQSNLYNEWFPLWLRWHCHFVHTSQLNTSSQL